jgi:hypothetical protein
MVHLYKPKIISNFSKGKWILALYYGSSSTNQKDESPEKRNKGGKLS